MLWYVVFVQVSWCGNVDEVELVQCVCYQVGIVQLVDLQYCIVIVFDQVYCVVGYVQVDFYLWILCEEFGQCWSDDVMVDVIGYVDFQQV